MAPIQAEFVAILGFRTAKKNRQPKGRRFIGNADRHGHMFVGTTTHSPAKRFNAVSAPMGTRRSHRAN